MYNIPRIILLATLHRCFRHNMHTEEESWRDIPCTSRKMKSSTIALLLFCVVETMSVTDCRKPIPIHCFRRLFGSFEEFLAAVPGDSSCVVDSATTAECCFPPFFSLSMHSVRNLSLWSLANFVHPIKNATGPPSLSSGRGPWSCIPL